jgi:hypothetical protein
MYQRNLIVFIYTTTRFASREIAFACMDVARTAMSFWGTQ